MVILIIAVLAAIALPQYNLAVEKSRAVRDLPLLRTLADARRLYELENREVNCNLEDLAVEFLL